MCGVRGVIKGEMGLLCRSRGGVLEATRLFIGRFYTLPHDRKGREL